MEKTLKVERINCGHCEARVKAALEALPEVESAVASHETGSARYADMVTRRLPARLRDGLTAEVCEPVQGGIRLAKRAAEKTAAR